MVFSFLEEFFLLRARFLILLPFLLRGSSPRRGEPEGEQNGEDGSVASSVAGSEYGDEDADVNGADEIGLLLMKPDESADLRV
jgi:hypothetical protein